MKKTNNKKAPQKRTLDKVQQEKREKSIFKRKIHDIFTGAGFTYIPTNDHEMIIGHRAVEVDSLFVFENIWLICEDTIKTTNIRDHIRTKNEAAKEIRNNLQSFVDELIRLYPEKEEIIKKYDIRRLKIFALYISKNDVELNDGDSALFSELIFVQPKTLSYFQWIVQCIKNSARNEIFRYLNIKDSDIGVISSSSSSTEIAAPIIYPRSFTGLNNNVRIVSFMMSAEDLLHTCYVMRKDSWSESIWLYQRLIEKKKITGIRAFLENNGEAFYNNIIVGLPDRVRFRDEGGDYKTIEEISDLEENCQLVIPKEMNSLCVIDGQHRIYAHYDSGIDSKQERKIAQLRKQLHLLVTGLVFPTNMSEEERARIQSKIFVDINSNTKLVPQNVLLQIKRMQNPIDDESIAQFVIEQLNKEGIFKNLLQISSLEEGKIKTASIVRFALRYLTTVHPTEDHPSLYTYWPGNKDDLQAMKYTAIEEYVKYCAKILRSYFGAIKKNFEKQWGDDNSKLLSVISINGFIIALNRQLKINGIQEFEDYVKVFDGWDCDFSKNGFPYTSSQYHKFSTCILREAFKINDDTIETL